MILSGIPFYQLGLKIAPRKVFKLTLESHSLIGCRDLFSTLADEIDIEESQRGREYPPGGADELADQLTEIPIIRRSLKSSKRDSRSNIFSQGN